jgi:hypothetical protein
VGFEIEKSLSENGAVSRGVCVTDKDASLIEVTERTHIQKVAGGIAYINESNQEIMIPEDTVVSMNFWGFTPSLFGHLEKGFHDFIIEHAQDTRAEYYIPSVINDLVKSGRASVKILRSSGKWFGMTYKEDRDDVVAGIQELIGKGVYPHALWK